MNGAPLLEVDNLSKHYRMKGGFLSSSSDVVRAVDGVSFNIKKGETFGLVGESGCGKTTVARCIVRLIEPTSGAIRLSGENILEKSGQEMRPLRRRIQMIFQDPYGSLNPRMTAEKIIQEPLEIHNVGDQTQRSKAVDELLQMVGLDRDCRKHYPHQFSGGQRQRIGIARALALRPELIVADEPVSALDVSVQAQIINLLKQLQDSFQLTFLFIAHDLSVVHHFSDRVAVMYLGKIVELASSTGLFRRPLHPYTKMLLESIPVAEPSGRVQRPVLDGEVPSLLNIPSGCRFRTRCPVAVDLCRSLEPELRELRPGHWAACHLVEP